MKRLNLVIVHTPGEQDRRDWETVAAKVEATDPEIDVRIADNRVPDTPIYAWLKTRPSLVFSCGILRDFAPPTGKIYAGQQMSKLQELRQLNWAGVTIPTTAPWVRELDNYSPAVWGSHVVVKPLYGMKGRGISLLPTKAASECWSLMTHNGETKLVLQRFIDSGSRPNHFRVLTAFGIPLYMTRRWAAKAEADQPRAPRDPQWRLVTNSSPHIEIVVDHQVLAFARRIGASFPDIPVLGCDIVREEATGKLFALEANTFGQTWHFSSDTHNRLRQKTGLALDYYSQFGALDLLAAELVRRVRGEAH